MNTAMMSLEEYGKYVTSTVAFMEMWQSCYFALLSNSKYAEHSMDELHNLSWEHAKELKRATRQYLERQHGNIPIDSLGNETGGGNI